MGWTNIRDLMWEWKGVNFYLEMSQITWKLHLYTYVKIPKFSDREKVNAEHNFYGIQIVHTITCIGDASFSIV